MARCKDCGTKVSCSCQLTKGRCSACNFEYQQSLKEPIKPYTENDKSKIK